MPSIGFEVPVAAAHPRPERVRRENSSSIASQRTIVGRWKWAHLKRRYAVRAIREVIHLNYELLAKPI
jgi:hypothetical protein